MRKKRLGVIEQREKKEAQIKENVEMLTPGQVVEKMLKNGVLIVDWEPLAGLLACRIASEKLHPKKLILKSGTEITVSEKNCWRKIENISFLLTQKGVFRDPVARKPEEKYPAIRIIWAGDEQYFIPDNFAVFKDMKNARKFMEAFQRNWSIIIRNKNLGRLKVSYLKTAVVRTVEIE